MLFLQLFRSLEGKEVVVEMRNDLIISGILSSADQFYNFKLKNVKVIQDPFGFYPLYIIDDIFIRGSSIRYIGLKEEDVDLDLLHDATRRHNQ